MLRNEIYKGDVMMQKTYLDADRVRHKNTGQKDRYYIADNHPAIVDADVWNKVQEILDDKSIQIRMEGMDYDIELSEPREDQVEKIRSMDNVEYAGIAVKCAVLEQYQDKSLDKIKVYWLDETCWKKQTIPALESYEGSYPQNENEIMLGMNALNAMGIQNPEIGRKLPVTYSTLADDANEELMENEFVLSGWYTDYSGDKRGYVSEGFFETTGVKQTDFTQGTLKIYAVYDFYQWISVYL